MENKNEEQIQIERQQEFMKNMYESFIESQNNIDRTILYTTVCILAYSLCVQNATLLYSGVLVFVADIIGNYCMKESADCVLDRNGKRAKIWLLGRNISQSFVYLTWINCILVACGIL